jgi:hypothetical protein
MQQEIINIDNPIAIDKFNLYLINQNLDQLFNIRFKSLKLLFDLNMPIEPDHKVYHGNHRFHLYNI